MGSQEPWNSNGRRTDRCGVYTLLTTLLRPLSVAYGDCVIIDLIWGVIDTVPETNFPDIRNRCAIHAESGSCMVIPREGDKVRLYVQLSDKQVVDPATGRVDKNRVSTDYILQVKIMFYVSCLPRLSRVTHLCFTDSQESHQTLHYCRPRD